MKVLERVMDLLKCIRHDTPTRRDIEEHTGLSASSVVAYLEMLEAHGFVESSVSMDRQTKGRAPRVYTVAAAWRGRAI